MGGCGGGGGRRCVVKRSSKVRGVKRMGMGSRAFKEGRSPVSTRGQIHYIKSMLLLLFLLLFIRSPSNLSSN